MPTPPNWSPGLCSGMQPDLSDIRSWRYWPVLSTLYTIQKLPSSLELSQWGLILCSVFHFLLYLFDWGWMPHGWAGACQYLSNSSRSNRFADPYAIKTKWVIIPNIDKGIWAIHGSIIPNGNFHRCLAPESNHIFCLADSAWEGHLSVEGSIL